MWINLLVSLFTILFYPHITVYILKITNTHYVDNVNKLIQLTIICLLTYTAM